MDVAGTTVAVGQSDSVAAHGVQLVVDFGTVTSRAMVCWPDGRRVPLFTGGAGPYWPAGRHWPSGVWVDGGRVVAGPDAVAAAHSDPDRFCRDLKSVLTHEKVTVGDASLEPVAGLAAVLALLADQAQQVAGVPVTGLAMTLPAGWGPRRRVTLRAAAQRAGLPAPHLIPAPVAAGWLLSTSGLADLPPGSLLLVCDFGYAAFEASLLLRTGSEFVIQATARTPGSGGQAAETVLVEHCLAAVDVDLAERLRNPLQPTDQRDRTVLDTTVHLAARRLATGQSASVLLPTPCPPLHITTAQYAELVAPITARCADTAAGVVQAADLDAGRLTGVYAIGGSTTDPALDGLTERGLEPVEVPDPELATLLGAAATPAPDQPAPPPPKRAKRLNPHGALGTAVAAGASLVLIGSALYTSSPIPGLGPLPDVNWGEYAMACCLALLATTTAAQTLTRLPSARKMPGHIRIPRLARGVIIGLVTTLVYAAAGIHSLTLPWSAGTYLRWALYPAVPIAACATLVGLLHARYPRQAARAEPTGRRRWFPTEATTAACVGMILIQLPMLGDSGHEWEWNALLVLLGPDGAHTTEAAFGRIGAILLGAGTALAVTTSGRWRILTVPVAAAITGIIPEFDLTTQLGVAFVAAVSLWWAIRAGRLTIATAPYWRPHLPMTLRPTITRPETLNPSWAPPNPSSRDAYPRQAATSGEDAEPTTE